MTRSAGKPRPVGSALAERVGADRVLEPASALPQPAERLDAGGPVRRFEIELEVDTLSLDSSSARQLAVASGDDPQGIADRIADIVGSRGKMHNPVTDSGGVMIGRVRSVGPDHPGAPPVGARVAALASLTLIPLRLEHVGPVRVGSPQVPVRGTAYLAGIVAWAEMPHDLPAELALAVFDVCGVTDHVRAWCRPGHTVVALGAGLAGRLALAAARELVGDRGTLVAVDSSARAVRDVREHGLCDLAVQADLTDAVGTAERLGAAQVPPADVTIVVVNARGCEAGAILATADTGTILFFSMATSFSAAALTADGLGSKATMIIGSGYSEDRGAHAIQLVRGDRRLRAALSACVAGAR